MKKTIQTIAAFAALAIATPAIAGGVTVAEKGDSKLKIGGKIYVDATSKTTKNQAGTQKKSVGVGVSRLYFSAGYAFDDVWSMGLTTDFAVAPAASGLKKRSTVYVKKAYLQGKFSPALVLQAGIIGTPWIGHEEHLWKHRYVSKVFVDTYHMDSSADAGIGLKGKLAGGMVDYHITEVNGGGYGNISKSNAVDLNARIGFKPVDGLTLDLQFRDGYWGQKTYGVTKKKNRLIQALATYGMDGWRVGANYINYDNKQGLKAPIANTKTKSKGYDVWAWSDFGGIGVFGRFESVKHTITGNTLQPKTTRFLLGLDYSPRKNVNFSLAYDHSKTTNYDGTTVAPGNFQKDTTFGLFSQVKF